VSGVLDEVRKIHADSYSNLVPKLDAGKKAPMLVRERGCIASAFLSLKRMLIYLAVVGASPSLKEQLAFKWGLNRVIISISSDLICHCLVIRVGLSSRE
jgi:hypothetical protein